MAVNLPHVVAKLVGPLHRRVVAMISRAVVRLVDNTQAAPVLQVDVRADQLRDDVESFEHYGFTSAPAADAEAILVAVGGSTDHGVVVATTDRRYRPTTLVEGEVALYTLQNGIRVLLKQDGTVLVGTTPTDFVALATPTHAEIDALRTTVNNLITVFNAHIHPGTYLAGAVPIAPTATAATPPATVGSVAAVEVKAK